MKTLILFLAGSLVAVAQAPTYPELVLGNGQRLKQARVAAITGESVTLIHAAGTTTVRASEIDLEILARAQIALEQQSTERAARTQAARKAAEARIAKEEEDKRDQVFVAQAISDNRDRTAGVPTAPPAAGRAATPVITEQTIIALKQRFPAKTNGRARVFIPKSGQGGKPYIISSTFTEISGGPSISSTRMTQSSSGRVDSIEYEAPSADMWSWYRGMIQTTTLQALPRTLKMIEDRIPEDERKMRDQAGGSSVSGQAQAKHTLHWFSKELRPYLDEWRKLIR